MELKLKEIGEILGLRETGSRLRQQIELALSKNEKVLLDFDEVESVSSSFADELIAKLFVSLGAITFTKNIQLKNVNSFTKTIINACIKDRLNDITEC